MRFLLVLYAGCIEIVLFRDTGQVVESLDAVVNSCWLSVLIQWQFMSARGIPSLGFTIVTAKRT